MTNAELAQWDSAVVSYCFVWEFFLTLTDLLLVCYRFRSCIFTGFVFVLCFWASVALFFLLLSLLLFVFTCPFSQERGRRCGTSGEAGMIWEELGEENILYETKFIFTKNKNIH